MFSKIRKSALFFVPAIAISLLSGPAAHAEALPDPVDEKVEISPRICDGPSPIFVSSNVKVSERPTNAKSAYMQGPATISYTKTGTTTVGATLTGGGSVDASVIIAKASAQFSIALSGSRSWTDGFTYQKSVPAGKTQALQLFQESRAFVTKKQVLKSPCTYSTVYTSNVNAPTKTRKDVWRLVN